MMTATVTSCSGRTQHECFEVLPVRPGGSGIVQIGQECYLVTCIGPDDFEFRKSDGKVYAVSCWSEQRGNYSCECRDWQIRRTEAQRMCKHLAAAFRLKKRLQSAGRLEDGSLPSETDKLTGGCWER